MKNILEFAEENRKAKMNNKGAFSGSLAIVTTIVGLIIAAVIIATNLSTIWSPSTGLGNTTTGAPAYLMTTLGVIFGAVIILTVMKLAK